MGASDTTPEAAAIHLEAQRRLGPAGRLRSALELSNLARAFMIAGIRKRNPELSEKEAIEIVVKHLYLTGNASRGS